MITYYQQKLLEILNFYHNFCMVNNLRYYAVGGTFLGAVRHGGFIPWDDDIDVCMPREDYEKMIRLLVNKTGRFVLETPRSLAKDFLYTNSKIFDTSTTVIEDIKVKTKRGVFLDIFPLDGIGNNEVEINRNYFFIDLLNGLFATRTCKIRKGRELWKNIAIFLSCLIPSSLINEKKIISKLDYLCSKHDFNANQYCGLLLTQYRKKYIMNRVLFDEIETYKFENQVICGVKDYDSYLTHLFGNWHQLPPEEKRNSGHDLFFVDLNSSYLKS